MDLKKCGYYRILQKNNSMGKIVIRCEICHEIINRPNINVAQYVCEGCCHGGKSHGGIPGESCIDKSIKYKEIKEGWEDDRIAQIYEDSING